MKDITIKNIILIVFSIIIMGCATFGVGGEAGKVATNSFQKFRDGICNQPVELRIIIQNEIDLANVNGIDIALMCSEHNVN